MVSVFQGLSLSHSRGREGEEPGNEVGNMNNSAYVCLFICKVAEYMVDPFCRGIFAGDARLLSLRSCFPPLYELENKHGSIIKGVLKSSLKPG